MDHNLYLDIKKATFYVKKNSGMLIIDEVNGFCTVGAGNMAPLKKNHQVDNMIKETTKLAKKFYEKSLPISLFLDTHEDNRLEHPFPPHCIKGTGEEKIISELEWLIESDSLKINKDCINGFIGAIDKETNKNIFIQWIKDYKIESLIVTGICTDICVLDFVLTCMSAINHQIINPLKEIIVYSEACATYHMNLEDVKMLNLTNSMIHDQKTYHDLGLKIMQMRGAIIANKITF
ncbi:isochorismatase family protein [Alphaproteobacteria bacterium]|nr:isochorismatase family protein [Alphaproteobacteria bacterium]